ncbi:2-oxoacid:acceptor oxidoreductase family protein [Candidatus Pacearchaeota archaeon]|nr:2-oxoacid:acceptor oxidoreductase family protein [Candidatus Pacearchaeota archaeon]
MRFSILIGGKAGQGPNILTQLVGEALVNKGYFVFYSRDYESLIRGGHNFNTLTFSDSESYSNDSVIDIIVALDENSVKKHKDKLKKGGIIIEGSGKDNMYFAGRLFKVLCMDFSILEKELKKLRNFDENLKNSRIGYEEETRACIVFKANKGINGRFMNGSSGIAEGAIKSGMEVYYAYPMTPATPVLFELASKKDKGSFKIFELENEISVICAAIGSSAWGMKSMVGTSGGGFDLMTEAMSFAGQAEIPIVCYLASRPGPGTGVATSTGQGDLNMARHCGHGEFFRMIVAGGDPKECEELTSQSFYFSQKYKIPAIVMSDKHLAESFYTIGEEAKITKSEKTMKAGRYNSYEHTETGEATEDTEITKKNFERRMKKAKEIEKEAGKFEQYKIYGKKTSKNLIISYGSTKGAILDSISGKDAKFLQILYIEPFSEKIKDELKKAEKIVLVENSATGMLADLIAEKTGIIIKDKILKYDGRAFFCDELSREIEEKIK